MFDGWVAALKSQVIGAVLSGGLIVGIAAVMVAALRRVPGQIWGYARRGIIATAVIDSRNDLFQSYIAWLNDSRIGRRSRLFSVMQTATVAGENEAARDGMPRLQYSPAPGFHLFWHRGRLMWIEREIAMNLQVVETLKISAFLASRKHLEAMLEDVLDQADARLYGFTALHAVDRWGDNWHLVGAKPRRRLDSVVLAGDNRARLQADIEQFFTRRKWYADLGIPWRRGYLFYGPPGTGKTSLAFALAGELKLALCTLSLMNPKLNDQTIADLLQRTPPRSMILIEDIDAFFTARAKQDERIDVSFSGVLNAIDGVAAQEGRIVVLTTNRREALDPALVRPGRIDLALELGLASPEQIEAMFLKFHPDEKTLAAALARELPANKLSPATLQQALLAHPGAAQAAAALRAMP